MRATKNKEKDKYKRISITISVNNNDNNKGKKIIYAIHNHRARIDCIEIVTFATKRFTNIVITL